MFDIVDNGRRRRMSSGEFKTKVTLFSEKYNSYYLSLRLKIGEYSMAHSCIFRNGKIYIK